jgi:hypothetical protein
MNWGNKLVCYATNVGLVDYSGCYSTVSSNGFLIVLIVFGVVLLSLCGNGSCLTLVSNKLVCK